MKCSVILTVAALVTLTVGAAFADEADVGVSNRIPKTIAEKLLQAADRQANQAAEKQMALENGRLNQIHKALSKERAKLEEQLKSQPEYADYRSAADQLLRERPKSEQEARQQAEAFAQLHQRYRDMYVRAYKAARIDERKVIAVLSQAYGARVVPIKGAPGAYRVLDGGPQRRSPKQACPGPPYPELSASTYKRSYGVVVIHNRASATPSTGKFHCTGGVVTAAVAKNGAVVGRFVQVPPGRSKLIVTARIHAAYRMSAYAFFGASGAQANATVQTVGIYPSPGVQTASERLARVIAPLFWGASEHGEKVVYVTKTFTIPTRGGWYLIQAGGSTSSFGILGGAADVRNGGTALEICYRSER